MNILRKAFLPLRKKQAAWAIVTAISLFAAATGIQILYSITLGSLADETSTGDAKLWLLSISLLLMALITVLMDYFSRRLQADVVHRYRDKAFTSILRAPIDWYRKHQQGDLFTQISQNTTQAASFLTQSGFVLLRSALAVLLSLVVIALINWTVALYFLGLLILSIVVQNFLAKPLQSIRMKIFTAIRRSMAYASDMLSSMKVLQVEQRQDWAVAQYEKELRTVERQFLRLILILASIMLIMFTASILPALFIIFYPALLSARNIISYSSFIVILTLGIPVATIVLSISQTLASMQQSIADLKLVSLLWQIKGETADLDDAYSSIPLKENIALELKSIDFSYADDRPVFQEFSQEFHYGETYLLTGPNGSGKSTLSALLQALRIPQNGHIYIDGMDTDTVKRRALRRRVSVDTQKAHLFEGTILSNIQLSAPNQSEEELNQWWDESSFSVLFKQFGNGIHSLVEADGKNLSGGQQKCISIARTIVAPSDIKIFDEPTANVDKQSALAIIEEIKKVGLDEDKVLILITHDEGLIDVFPETKKLKLKGSSTDE